MATAESVKAKIQGLINTVNSTTGGADTDLTAAVNALIAGFGQGGGGVKVTEYVVTEDADRSLWFNEQQIKLVKGLNYLVISDAVRRGAIVNNRSGLIVNCMILWDGVSGANAQRDTFNTQNHLRGWHSASNAWSAMLGAGNNSLCSGNTTALSVSEDGVLSFTTSATGVTTGNYNNSFFGAGNTYYLLQAESEVVC